MDVVYNLSVLDILQKRIRSTTNGSINKINVADLEVILNVILAFNVIKKLAGPKSVPPCLGGKERRKLELASHQTNSHKHKNK